MRPVTTRLSLSKLHWTIHKRRTKDAARRTMNEQQKELRWIAGKIWARLSLETNEKVICGLIFVGRRLLRSPSVGFEYDKDIIVVRAVLDLMRRPLGVKCRATAIGLLNRMMHRSGTNDECGLHVVQASLRFLTEHFTISPLTERSLRRTMFCLHRGLKGCDEAVSRPQAMEWIISDEYTLPLLFEGVRSERNVQYNPPRIELPYRRFLADVFKFTEDRDRITLIVRHYPLLMEAFEVYIAGSKSRWHSSHPDTSFFELPEFGAIFVSSPSLLRLAFETQQHICDENDKFKDWPGVCDSYDEISRVMVLALEDCLNDKRRLRDLLGMGFLSVARHLSMKHWWDEGPRFARVFKTILAAHPIWCNYYAAITRDGKEFSVVTRLGRRPIPDRDDRPGTDYIWYDEGPQM